MKKYAVAVLMAGALACSTPAHADRVGAVFGAGSGLVLAGPPGAIIGFFIGLVYGRPYWGPSTPYSCYLDDNFVRHCPKMPVN